MREQARLVREDEHEHVLTACAKQAQSGAAPQ